jgi:murein L,D-transpeptidase YcbB/YkuD
MGENQDINASLKNNLTVPVRMQLPMYFMFLTAWDKLK